MAFHLALARGIIKDEDYIKDDSLIIIKYPDNQNPVEKR